MFFKNLIIFKLPVPFGFSREVMEEHLAKAAFSPCLPTQRVSCGWVSPVENENLVHEVNGQWLISLREAKRLLPSFVIKKAAADRAKEIEQREGRKVGRKEMRELKEVMTLELLPASHVKESETFVWMDTVNGLFCVNASSYSKAEGVLETLRKSIEGFSVRLINLNQSPASAMTEWLISDEPPLGFTVDQDCELQSPTEGKATVRYTHHTLDCEEPRAHLAAGKVPKQLAVTWNDRVSFVLTDSFALKRVSFLDLCRQEAGEAESAAEKFDADLMLMSGELGRLVGDLIGLMGGLKPAETDLG